jgi:hypothetical protein
MVGFDKDHGIESHEQRLQVEGAVLAHKPFLTVSHTACASWEAFLYIVIRLCKFPCHCFCMVLTFVSFLLIRILQFMVQSGLCMSVIFTNFSNLSGAGTDQFDQIH